MKAIVGGDAAQVIQGAQHSIFVEGSDDEAIDPVVIRELLRVNDLPQVAVKPMGGCDNVRSAAQALIRHHPSYYFLIDRDDQDVQSVERSWTDFPDPDTHNVIIWRKRELENYFIDPDYLAASAYLRIAETALRQRILAEANRRVFIDAANLTLLALNRELRRPVTSYFSDPSEFLGRTDGEAKLRALEVLEESANAVAAAVSASEVVRRYTDFVDDLSGGVIPLEYESGSWLGRMSGKEIFRVIAGAAFKVKAVNGRVLQGKTQHNEIAKELLRGQLAAQPTDFQALVGLLRARVSVNQGQA